MAQDEIDRAYERNSVKPGSPLETLVRQNIYRILGTDASGRDEKLDSYINEHRKNEFYGACFTAHPPAKVSGVDTLHLSEEQRRGIDDGTLVIEAEAKQESATISPATIQATAEQFEEIRRSGRIAVGK